MKRGLPWADAFIGLALALVGCSSDSNPVLAPAASPSDTPIGDRGVQVIVDAAPLDTQSFARDVVADVPLGKDVSPDTTVGIDAPPPLRIAVAILYPTAGASDGGAPVGGSSDGGAGAVVISSSSRFAPKVSVEVESRGGDPTTEVLASVVARLMAPKTTSPVASVKLNQTQYNVLPESASKSYLFSDTPFDLSKIPSGTYDLFVDATTVGGATSSASVSIYVDGGPAITFLQPADGAYVKGGVIVTAIVSDSQASVTSVTFSVGQTELPAAAISSSGVQYTATIDFNSFEPPLDGAQIVSVTAVNSNAITSVASRTFTVDNTGPTITGTKPASGDLIGRLLTIEAKVEDPAGVMSGSVVAVVAHGDIHFEVNLVKTSEGPYRQTFDTTQLPEYAIFPSISFRAQDVLGNQSSVGYLVSLDNTPPIVDLDPPANFRLYKKDGTCSWPFDPVGPDAIDDGSVVNQLFDIRARIEDEGNQALTGSMDFVVVSGIDPTSVKVLILDDTTLPLVVDTSDPPDGICDDINPELIPSVSPQAAKDAQLLDMVSLPANAGAGDFTYEPGSSCSGTDQSSPDPFCKTTYSLLKHESMTYSLGSKSGVPSIWSIGPVVSDGIQCAGRQFDASNNLHDGFACVAAVAADHLGNKQVSRPIRMCVAAQVGSTACTPTAMGGAALASVTIPATTTGSVGFVTSTPLVGGAGSALKDGDEVVFSDVGPGTLVLVNGTRPVTPVDTTGKSFTFSNLHVTPPTLLLDNDPDAGAPASQGYVGLVLTDGALVHVVTPAGKALDPSYAGQVIVSNAGFASGTRWSVSNIQPSGFDLVGSTVKLTGGAVALSKLPDCTGTVIKQTSGLAPKVDSSKPCKQWRTYPQSEGMEL
jgi:hypothetical protein